MQLPVYGHSAARCWKCEKIGFYDSMVPKQVDFKWNVRYAHPDCIKEM